MSTPAHNEKLIEEARTAVAIAKDSIWRTSPDADGDARHEEVLDRMLAVFEKAHTPTDDERVARLMAYVTPLGYASALALIEAETKMLAEANEAESLKRQIEKLDADMGREIDRVEELHDIADRLSWAIAPMEVIGEHSSANDPWENAIEFAQSRVWAEPQGEPSDARGVIARALMDSARMDTFNAWSLAEEIAAALRAAGVGGAR